jgi:hypothetical protein
MRRAELREDGVAVKRLDAGLVENAGRGVVRGAGRISRLLGLWSITAGM